MTNELAFQSREAALEVAKLLLKEDYIVMLSTEENLTILNYEWEEYGDRNDVVFMDRETFDMKYIRLEDEEDGCKD